MYVCLFERGRAKIGSVAHASFAGVNGYGKESFEDLLLSHLYLSVLLTRDLQEANIIVFQKLTKVLTD